jgi:hypothetical protein
MLYRFADSCLDPIPCLPGSARGVLAAPRRVIDCPAEHHDRAVACSGRILQVWNRFNVSDARIANQARSLCRRRVRGVPACAGRLPELRP